MSSTWAKPTVDKPLRVAIVGYGQIAELHTSITAREGHRLSWLVGRRREPTEAFARRHGFARSTTSLDTALADPEVDAVILCTPNDQHAGQALRCLEAGKHALVEIPLAMSYVEGERVAELARATGLTVMVAHTHRYLGAMRRVRERVAAGEATFHHIIARYLLLRRENVGSSGYVRSWTDNLLWHHAHHSTDIVLWLLGVQAADEVEVALAQIRPDPKAGTPLELTLVLHTANDQLGTIAASYNNDMGQIYDYFLTGPGETLRIEQNVLRDRGGILFDQRADPAEVDGRVLQNREFFAAVREHRPAAISADSVLPALRVLQRAQDQYDAGTALGKSSSAGSIANDAAE